MILLVQDMRSLPLKCFHGIAQSRAYMFNLFRMDIEMLVIRSKNLSPYYSGLTTAGPQVFCQPE